MSWNSDSNSSYSSADPEKQLPESVVTVAEWSAAVVAVVERSVSAVRVDCAEGFDVDCVGSAVSSSEQDYAEARVNVEVALSGVVASNQTS